ncbi:MAG: hypothetical protein RR428_09180 [Coprobacillus sp.]
MAKRVNDPYAGLSMRQINILKMKEQLNKPDPNAIKPFQKYKIMTYIFNILFPPYALYRIWKKDSPFCITEQVGQSMVCIIYMFTIISMRL